MLNTSFKLATGRRLAGSRLRLSLTLSFSVITKLVPFIPTQNVVAQPAGQPASQPDAQPVAPSDSDPPPENIGCYNTPISPTCAALHETPDKFRGFNAGLQALADTLGDGFNGGLSDIDMAELDPDSNAALVRGQLYEDYQQCWCLNPECYPSCGIDEDAHDSDNTCLDNFVVPDATCGALSSNPERFAGRNTANFAALVNQDAVPSATESDFTLSFSNSYAYTGPVYTDFPDTLDPTFSDNWIHSEVTYDMNNRLLSTESQSVDPIGKPTPKEARDTDRVLVGVYELCGAAVGQYCKGHLECDPFTKCCQHPDADETTYKCVEPKAPADTDRVLVGVHERCGTAVGQYCKGHLVCDSSTECCQHPDVDEVTYKCVESAPITVPSLGKGGDPCSSFADCEEGLLCFGGVCRGLADVQAQLLETDDSDNTNMHSLTRSPTTLSPSRIYAAYPEKCWCLDPNLTAAPTVDTEMTDAAPTGSATAVSETTDTAPTDSATVESAVLDPGIPGSTVPTEMTAESATVESAVLVIKYLFEECENSEQCAFNWVCLPSKRNWNKGTLVCSVGEEPEESEQDSKDDDPVTAFEPTSTSSASTTSTSTSTTTTQPFAEW